jgi:hypothetical protein
MIYCSAIMVAAVTRCQKFLEEKYGVDALGDDQSQVQQQLQPTKAEYEARKRPKLTSAAGNGSLDW